MTLTATTTAAISPLTILDLPMEIWIPDWMTEIPNTEIDAVDLIHTQIKNGAHGTISSYVLICTMLDRIQEGASLKAALDAADDLNEIYTAYDITIDKDHGRWILMIDCNPTRAEVVIDLSSYVAW
jgi:hypothetical protein